MTALKMSAGHSSEVLLVLGYRGTSVVSGSTDTLAPADVTLSGASVS